MPDLLKSAFLLERTPGGTASGYVLFTDPEIHQPPAIRLPLHYWNDMGKPDEITVTVEPGDTLNEEPPPLPMAAGDPEPLSPGAPAEGQEG